MCTNNLLDLKPNEKGIITSIKATSVLINRFKVLGLRLGREVEMVKNAPLKDPIEFSIGSIHLSINRKEAEQIKIKKH